MQIFVINLPRSASRRQAMSEGLGRVGLPFTLYPAVDGADADQVFLPRFDNAASLRRRGIALTPGEKGAACSHVGVWQRCVDLGEPILVMEDDIKIGPSLPAALTEIAAHIDRLGLVRLQMVFPRKSRVVETVGHEFRIVRYLRGGAGLQCYAIAPAAAGILLRGASPMLYPVDLYVERFWDHGIVPYGLEPFPVDHQGAAFPSEIGRRIRKQPSLGLRLARETHRLFDNGRRVLFNLTHP